MRKPLKPLGFKGFERFFFLRILLCFCVFLQKIGSKIGSRIYKRIELRGCKPLPAAGLRAHRYFRHLQICLTAANAEGLTIGKSLFWTTYLAGGFRDTNKKAPYCYDAFCFAGKLLIFSFRAFSFWLQPQLRPVRRSLQREGWSTVPYGCYLPSAEYLHRYPLSPSPERTAQQNRR